MDSPVSRSKDLPEMQKPVLGQTAKKGDYKMSGKKCCPGCKIDLIALTHPQPVPASTMRKAKQIVRKACRRGKNVGM